MAASLQPDIARALAGWAVETRTSPLQHMLSVAGREEVISLALGLPDASLFPREALAEAATRVLQHASRTLQYSEPSSELREHLCELVTLRGVHCRPDQIMLTSGAQQGITMLARLFLDYGGPLIEEEYSYTGFQQVVEPFCPRICVVPSGPSCGIDTDALQHLLERYRPALLYIVSDGHNPLGLSLTVEQRCKLAGLAAEHGVPLIEDDPYGFLQYGEDTRAIRASAEEWVFYVGSFSKILAPALRMGWIVAPAALMPRLAIIKESLDINTATFGQRVAAEFIQGGFLEAHIERLRSVYKSRRDRVWKALQECLPPFCRFRLPPAGVFFWVELPENMDAAKILEVALERHQVAFLPAQAFTRGRRRNGMRLNFSRCSDEVAVEGVRRIGLAIRECAPA